MSAIMAEALPSGAELWVGVAAIAPAAIQLAPIIAAATENSFSVREGRAPA